MARKPEIQYVRYYSVGTAAKVLERQPVAPKPKVQVKKAPVHRIVVSFDPIAVIGTMVAVVMLVCMLAGIVHLAKVNDEIAAMESYVSTLQSQNTRLQAQYRESFDLQTVKTTAESMGLVPKDQVRHITVRIPEPVVEKEPSWWESVVTNFKELFA